MASKAKAKNVARPMNGGASAPSSRNRSRRNRRNNRMTAGTVVQPLRTQVAQVGPQLISFPSFGKADAHDEFPEGGLRVHGCLPPIGNATLPGNDLIGQGVSATAVSGLFFKGATNNANGIWCVSPTTAVSGLAGVSTVPLFGSATSPIAEIAQWFRRFRFRKLWLEYDTVSPTTQTGAVQIGYDRDPLAAIDSYTNASQQASQAAMATVRTMRFPTYSNQVVVPLIDDRRSSPADELFLLTASGVQLAGGASNADFDRFFQGSVVGIFDQLSPTTGSQVLLGRLRWGFVLDLYGFSNNTGDNVITSRGRAVRGTDCSAAPSEQKREVAAVDPPTLRRTDSVSSYPSLGDEPELLSDREIEKAKQALLSAARIVRVRDDKSPARAPGSV